MFVKCESGAIYQERCDSGQAATCDVRWIPPYQRGTAEAAGTKRGMWEHLHVCSQCYSAISTSLDREPDEWTEVL